MDRKWKMENRFSVFGSGTDPPILMVQENGKGKILSRFWFDWSKSELLSIPASDDAFMLIMSLRPWRIPCAWPLWSTATSWVFVTTTTFSRHVMGYISLIDSFFKLVELVKLWPQIGPNSVMCAPWHPLLRAAAWISQHRDNLWLIWKVRYKALGA